ncbi:MAG TPA: hypothetical protein DCQ64_27815 [Candidatus Rokubacteria bacterium]|nr:hypothetical protein [Candidatus Rokubacteria bacterium]
MGVLRRQEGLRQPRCLHGAPEIGRQILERDHLPLEERFEQIVLDGASLRAEPLHDAAEDV